MKLGKVFTTFMLSGALAACGGGGGGGSSSSSAADSAYTGSRAAAKVTAQSAKEFADTILGTTSINTAAAGFSAAVRRPTEPGTNSHLLQVQQTVTALVMEKIQPDRYQARAISESEPCPEGGSVTTSGNSDDTTHTGSVRMTFKQCTINDDLLDGSIDVDVTAYNSTYDEPTAAKITYNGLVARTEGETGTITGTISLNTNPATKTGTFTAQLHIKASTGEEGLVDMTINATENADLSTSMNISGKACVGSEGCVNITTATPLRFDTYSEPVAGSMVLSGANNSKARIVVISYGVVQVNVDANGDGVYEEQQLLN